MAKLYIYLSGKLEHSFNDKISSNDYFVCVNDKVNIPISSFSRLSFNTSESIEKSIAEAMLKLSGKIPEKNNIKIKIIKSFLNDYFSYSIKPAYSIIASILEIIRQHKDKEVVFISAKHDSLAIPMVGFKTTESLKGSSHLFYASLLPHILNNLSENVKYKVIYRSGDILVSNFFRTGLLKVINKVLFITFILKILLINFHLKKSYKKNNIESLLLVRNKHQARFAYDLSSNIQNSNIIFLPQLSQGGFYELSKICKEIRLRNLGRTIPIKSLFKSYIKTRKDMKDINRANSISSERVCINNIYLDINLELILKEVSSLNIFIYYKNLLQELLLSYKTKKFINFELVGKMAGIESFASRDANVLSISIQTALISSRPIPVFPYSSLFLTDSSPTKDLIENIGIEKKGKVKYLGPPYIIDSLREIKFIKRIGFFTQPYELEYSLEIIETLLKWCKTYKIELFIRYHPRDKPELYQPLLKKYHNCYIEDFGDKNLSTIFNSIDVIVTRTSSIAKESIASGIPIILCLWSEMDNSIVADYIRKNSSINYCTSNKTELNNLLNSDINLLLMNAAQLQHSLFLDKELEDLCLELEYV